MNRKSRAHRRLGFTLAELLIVVAIIAVLVGISIPIFTAQMDKTKIAANEYNIKSAEEAVLTDLMSNEGSGAASHPRSDTYYYYYDTGSAKISSTALSVDKNSNGIYKAIFIIYKTDTQVIGTVPHYVKDKTKLDEAIVNSPGVNSWNK